MVTMMTMNQELILYELWIVVRSGSGCISRSFVKTLRSGRDIHSMWNNAFVLVDDDRSIMSTKGLLRCEISINDKPLSKSKSASEAFCITDFGSTQGPALKLCFLIMVLIFDRYKGGDYMTIFH